MALTKFNFNSFDVTSAASKGLGFNASANGFSTIDPGAMTLIKTLTASSSSSISFVNGSSDVVLDNTYPIYQFKILDFNPASDQIGIDFQGSTNGGSSYGVTITSSFFACFNNESGSEAALNYQSQRDLAQSTSFQRLCYRTGNGADESCSGNLTIFNPSSTTFVKHFMSRFQNYNYQDYADDQYMAGYFNTTSAINAFKFQATSGNFDATIKLYGIKDS